MNELVAGLLSLLLEFRMISPEQNPYAPLVFALGCSIIGVLAVIVDVSFSVIKEGQSLLGLKHGLKNTSLYLLAWVGGAFGIGYLSQVLDIFQVSMVACATVGISWPIIFTQILKRFDQSSQKA